MKKELIIIIFVLLTAKASAQIVTDIYNVQQDPSLVGKQVAVLGIVTATTGTFNPQLTFIEDSDSGPWSGIVVRDRSANFSAVQGDKIRAIGTVIEHNEMTEILVDQYYVSTKDNQIETVKVKTADLATGSPTAESYESVLVQVDSITVINDNLGNGEWLVDDGSGACRIGNDSNYLLFDIPAIGTEINSITGIIIFEDSQFKLQPRNRADIMTNNSTSEYEIHTIQQSNSLIEKVVSTSGIVTATTGIYHPEKTYIEEPNGGSWSGILVWDSTATLQANEGDRIRVIGEVIEKNGLTEISVSSYEILSTGNPIPLAEVVTTADISAKGESYESVLVQLFDVYISDNTLGNGEWVVNDIDGACLGQRKLCRIGNDATGFTYSVPSIGSPYVSVTGILNYSNNMFKLEPRYMSDIVERAADPIGDTLSIIQRPIINVPAIIQPGDTLEILCDLSVSPTFWNASLIHKNREIQLISFDHKFNEDNLLWTLKAILPEIEFFELYDLKIIITGEDIDIEKDAVQVIPSYDDDFYFVHITDTHLPRKSYCRDNDYEQDTSEMDDFRAVIEDINLINPAFVLHTGDFVNEGELEDFINNRYYTKAKQILSEIDVPIYLVSGNHDVGGWRDTPMSDGTARRDWWKFFGWKYLNNPPESNPQYTQDYTFNYGNCSFIGMEAYLNYDWWKSDIYGGASFTNGQMTWLHKKLNDVEDLKLKILFYHYDFNNTLDLNNLGIDLALWGHTHSDYGSISERPYNLATEACCDGRRAYRLIRVQGNNIKPSTTLHAGRYGTNLKVEFVNDNSGSPTTTTAIVSNQTVEEFEHTLIKFSIQPGVISNIANGTLVQIDSLTFPWIAYIQTSVAARSTTEITIQYLTSKINKSGTFAKSFELKQNYPNPFNTGTTINFTIPHHLINPHIQLTLYNIHGKIIKKLFEGELPPGNYSKKWDGTDHMGAKTASGIYYYIIRSDGFSEQKTLIQIK
jgi:hypothetical protein